MLQPVQLGTAGGRTGTQMARGARATDRVAAVAAEAKPDIEKVERAVEYSGLEWYASTPDAEEDPAVLSAVVPDPEERRISQERPSREETRGQGPQSERVSGTPSEGRSHEHAGLLKTKIVGKIIPVAAFVLDKEGGAGKGRKPPNSQLKLGGGK